MTVVMIYGTIDQFVKTIPFRIDLNFSFPTVVLLNSSGLPFHKSAWIIIKLDPKLEHGLWRRAQDESIGIVKKAKSLLLIGVY